MTMIQPQLWVDRGASAVTFYQAAFGARVLYQVGEAEDIVAATARRSGARFLPRGCSCSDRPGPRSSTRPPMRSPRRCSRELSQSTAGAGSAH